MRKSIRRRTRKRSIHKKHNKKSRISKKNRNKRYVGGGCGAPSRMAPSFDGFDRWWRQNDEPLSSDPTSADNRYYSWTKYDPEMIDWLNANHEAFKMNNHERRPPQQRCVEAEKKDRRLLFNFKHRLEINLIDKTAKKIMRTNDDNTPPSYLMPLAHSIEAKNIEAVIKSYSTVASPTFSPVLYAPSSVQMPSPSQQQQLQFADAEIKRLTALLQAAEASAAMSSRTYAPPPPPPPADYFKLY